MRSYQNPYMEQQFPLGQFPQTVLPFEVPHVPSVVTAAVEVAPGAMVDVTGPMTGSPVVDDDGGLELVGDEEDPPSEQPF